MGMSLLQGVQNCISTFFNCFFFFFFFPHMLFTINLQAWEAMHACASRLLCWTKRSGAIWLYRCSLVLTFHLCLLLHSHWDSRSHQSDNFSVLRDGASAWGLSRGVLLGEMIQLCTWVVLQLVLFFRASAKRPGIDKITRKSVYVCL